jgi:hypothetical protein
MTIWYILCSFGTFSGFGIMYQEKSGNPDLETGLLSLFGNCVCGPTLIEFSRSKKSRNVHLCTYVDVRCRWPSADCADRGAG